MSFDLYQEAILEELRHPQNKGDLANAAVRVSETNASCGDALQIALTFDAQGERIENIAWQGNGCAISQAAMSLLSEKVRGMTKQAVQALEQKDIEELLGLEESIAYGRVKCLMLGLQAVKKAVGSS